MIKIVQILAVLSVIVILLIQPIDIRFTKASVLSVKIKYTILSLKIEPKKKKKTKLKEIFRAIKDAPVFYRSTRYFIRRSEISVYDFNYKSSSFLTPLNTSIYVVIPIMATYIKAEAKNVVFYDQKSDIADTQNDGFTIDISFKLRLIYLFIFAVIFLYYKLKASIRRFVKNV